MKKGFRSVPLLISLVIIFCACAVYMSGIPFLDLMELKTIDLRFKYRGALETTSQVVIAAIDEKSIAKEGKWIWPRSKMAELIDRLSEAGARVIAFDIGFLESDEQQSLKLLQKIETTFRDRNNLDAFSESFLSKLMIQTDNDRLLSESIQKSSARVILGYFFQMDPETLSHVTEEEVRAHQKNIQCGRYAFVRYVAGQTGKLPLLEAAYPQSNIPVISQSARDCGFFNMYPDYDGVVRWIPAVIQCNDQLYAPLSLKATAAFVDASISVTAAPYGIAQVRIGRTPIPTDEIGRILVNFRGGAKTFPHIPVTDILRDRVPQSALKGKIVLVGATATGIHDLRVTPFETIYPGVEIHANLIDSILAQDFIFHPAWAGIFDLLAIVVLCLTLGLVLSRYGAIAGSATSLVFCASYIALCQYLFSGKGLILNMVYPISTILVLYIAITGYRYLTESKQKRFIKNAFSTYLAPSVVKQLIDSPEKLVLGGEEREITAFFSDVQGFTSISEKLKPHELVELLNEFLTEMTDIILHYEGTVDKFEGDAIIALFGAPNDLKNHAEVACKACIDMQKRLIELRNRWKDKGKPELHMRIGLCTGPAVVGNMGSKNRMDYTMMGDTVNIAARLEGVNKIYGIYTLISDSTHLQAGNGFAVRELDAIHVMGKQEPVRIYQLLGYPEDISPVQDQTRAHYAEGLAAYRDRQWNRAIKCFEKALELSPEDGPSRTMKARSERYQVAPPPENWQGCYSMSTK